MHRWICLGARSKCRADALTANVELTGAAPHGQKTEPQEIEK